MSPRPWRSLLPSRPRALLAVAIAAIAALLPGCVTVYEPLLGLQRPVVVNMEAANFEGQKILVRCVPGDYVPPNDMDYLCRGVRTSLSNQGAEVEVSVPRGGRGGVDREEGEKPPDLIIELSGRLLHEDSVPILWLLTYFSLTLVPAITEFTFAQDISIRDTEGSLLLADTLQGRFVQYFGAGVWAVNNLANLALRKPDEAIHEDISKREFSDDLYGQISQLAFHARTRARVLRGFPGLAPAAGPASTTPAVPAPAGK